MIRTSDSLDDLIDALGKGTDPQIRLIGGDVPYGARLGVFSSSFNPVTRAHVALVESASAAFALDHVLALASDKNADKRSYEASLTYRLEMMMLAFSNSPRVSVGVTSHAFFADMIDALAQPATSGTALHFVLGFDTLERVLDPQGKYVGRYNRQFSTSSDAVEYLLTHSYLIVANRGTAGRNDVLRVIECLPASMRARVLYLDFPADLAEISSTNIRSLVAAGQDFSGFVPARVEEYIKRCRLYSS